VKPRRTHPSRALDLSNLQVLCSTCNWGKGNRRDDWRR
jgi:5-methylcytosine-specific restriction endonuclease McrA